MLTQLGKLAPVLIALLVLIVLLAIYFIRKVKAFQQGGWEGVLDSFRADAYAAMLWAERNFPDDAGRTKFLTVLDNTYYLLPAEVRKYISKDVYAVILQDWYDEAKDILDDGILNGSRGFVQRE